MCAFPVYHWSVCLSFYLSACLIVFICSAAEAASLGQEQCSRGPSYWCRSIQTATSCQAFSYCLHRVWEPKHHKVQQVCEGILILSATFSLFTLCHSLCLPPSFTLSVPARKETERKEKLFCAIKYLASIMPIVFLSVVDFKTFLVRTHGDSTLFALPAGLYPLPTCFDPGTADYTLWAVVTSSVELWKVALCEICWSRGLHLLGLSAG